MLGLTNQHLVYVEKIDPGLPLFLLNCTDSTLHGIFEAATHGKKNIDLYAWTSDGTQKTPYPAQVGNTYFNWRIHSNQDFVLNT